MTPLVTLAFAEIVALVSAGVAILSLVLNNQVVRKQIALQAEEIRAAVDIEKTRWLAETLDLFAEAEALTLGGWTTPEREADRLRLAQKLSTQADQGRLSFPNLDPHRKGQENPLAYQGSRQPAIDAVILAHDLLIALPSLEGVDGKEMQRLLFACRRVLVSEVQKSVDPRRRAQALKAQSRRKATEVETSYKEIRAIIEQMKAMKIDKISFG